MYISKCAWRRDIVYLLDWIGLDWIGLGEEGRGGKGGEGS